MKTMIKCANCGRMVPANPRVKNHRKFRTTAQDGKTYDTQFYNLDVIISVGYRVKSKQGTQFRIWATQRLKEYIIKGFALNDERFKTEGRGELLKTISKMLQSLHSSLKKP